MITKYVFLRISVSLQVILHVEVPPPVCEDCYNRVIAEFMKQAKVLLVMLNLCFIQLFIMYSSYSGKKKLCPTNYCL